MHRPAATQASRCGASRGRSKQRPYEDRMRAREQEARIGLRGRKAKRRGPPHSIKCNGVRIAERLREVCCYASPVHRDSYAAASSHVDFPAEGKCRASWVCVVVPSQESGTISDDRDKSEPRTNQSGWVRNGPGFVRGRQCFHSCERIRRSKLERHERDGR
jgi:hypothetical protein